MKKIVLILMVVTAFFVSCSNDSDCATTHKEGIYMRVIGTGSQPKDSEVLYTVTYGTSDTDQVIVNVSKEVLDFYQIRVQAGNYHWIGEVTKEE